MADSRALAVPELGAVFGIPDMAKRIAAVERRLVQSLEPFRAVLTPTAHANVTAPGKRLRPALAIVAAEIGATFDRRVIDAAVAVELVQIGSLIHDDMIEGAVVRRGRPTVNSADGPAVAVVTGDLVLAKAGLIAAGLGPEPAEMLADGLVDMATGQLQELRQLWDLSRSVEQTTEVAAAKTGALFACACRLGAWTAGLAPKHREALTRYGHAFGVFFQLLDDLLDVVGDADEMGKPTGADLAAGVFTTPTVLALQHRGAKTLARLLKRGDADAIAQARERIGKSKAIDASLETIEYWIAQARRNARRLPDSPARDGLLVFPGRYLDWALAQFAQPAAN